MKGLQIDKRGRLRLSEAQVQRACIVLLRLDGWRVFETHSHRAFASAGEPGQPDLVCIKGGRVLFLECKKPGGKAEPHQLEWGRRAMADGYEYLVIDEVTKLREEIAQ